MQPLMLTESFAIEIPDAVIATRLLEAELGRLNRDVWDTALVSRYLSARVLANPTRVNNIIGKINCVVDRLLEGSSLEDGEHQTENLRREYTYGLCTLVANRSQSRSLVLK